MSEKIHFFETPRGTTAVVLPFDLEEFIRGWGQLRSQMIRQMPPEFSRDEWAYLITFLDHENLLATFEQAFGKSVSAASAPVCALARPRGPIAIWLPNNVSLLGPLTLILLSLTGNPIRLKGGTKSEDLTGAFLEFIGKQVGDGPLRIYLREQIQYGVFDRSDARNVGMAASATQRIVFGSDASAEAVHNLPHPLESSGFSFVDRRSEAWLEKNAVDDSVLRNLLKVFAIYGQAGCTSPRRVVLLDGTKDDVIGIRNRLVDLWPEVIKRKPAMHVASANVMARQWAAALEWDARLAPDNAALFAAGPVELPEFSATMGLMCVGATPEQALQSLPRNIQTIGHAFSKPGDARWLKLLARTHAYRLVPIERMHHFGPVWDGQPFWQQAFDLVEVG